MTVSLSFPIISFYIAAVFYVISFLFYLVKKERLGKSLLYIGFIINLISEISGRYINLPFCNMFSESYFLPLSLSGIMIFLIHKDIKEAIWIYPGIIIFLILSIFFSEGYYPPYTLMSKSIYAHIFHLLDFTSHSLIFAAALISTICLFKKSEENISIKLFIYGFICLCISGFIGMFWSFLGRADVISWNHYFFHSIGIWLYYSGFLHIYFLKPWNRKSKAILLIIGSLLIFWLDILPQLGGLHKPGVLNVNLYKIF